MWPSLRWGIEHVDDLQRRLGELERTDPYANAKAIASQYLPENTPINVQLHFVMGGRAGAATIGNDVYYDILDMMYSVDKGTVSSANASQIVDGFAHEMHHSGLGPIIDRKKGTLNLKGPDESAFELLTLMVMEGSATYLINGHRGSMATSSLTPEQARQGEALITLSDQVFTDIFEKHLVGNDYEKAVAAFVGNGAHYAGAIMFAVIDHAGGLDAVMEVLQDPRQLLLAYNHALKATGAQSLSPFNSQLVERIASIGQ